MVLFWCCSVTLSCCSLAALITGVTFITRKNAGCTLFKRLLTELLTWFKQVSDRCCLSHRSAPQLMCLSTSCSLAYDCIAAPQLFECVCACVWEEERQMKLGCLWCSVDTKTDACRECAGFLLSNLIIQNQSVVWFFVFFRPIRCGQFWPKLLWKFKYTHINLNSEP